MRLPSRRLCTSRASLSAFKCALASLTSMPTSAATDSTAFSPWASISSISSRFGLARALPTRATCSYRRSLRVRLFMIYILTVVGMKGKEPVVTPQRLDTGDNHGFRTIRPHPRTGHPAGLLRRRLRGRGVVGTGCASPRADGVQGLALGQQPRARGAQYARAAAAVSAGGRGRGRVRRGQRLGPAQPLRGAVLAGRAAGGDCDGLRHLASACDGARRAGAVAAAPGDRKSAG